MIKHILIEGLKIGFVGVLAAQLITTLVGVKL